MPYCLCDSHVPPGQIVCPRCRSNLTGEEMRPEHAPELERLRHKVRAKWKKTNLPSSLLSKHLQQHAGLDPAIFYAFMRGESQAPEVLETVAAILRRFAIGKRGQGQGSVYPAKDTGGWRGRVMIRGRQFYVRAPTEQDAWGKLDRIIAAGDRA